MTDNNFTPPSELMQQWYDEARDASLSTPKIEKMVATRAAQWGAGQELEACVEWLANDDDRQALQTYRRPKPPSLKEQALAELEKVDMLWDTTEFGHETLNSLDTIRRALEALPE
jgi:hypothetical protein